MNVKVVYVDDVMDDPLSSYLDQHLAEDVARIDDARGNDEESFSYDEVRYDEGAGLASLLENPLIQESNIAIIDSKLFTTQSAEKGMLTGEEFRVVLRRAFPYIQTFVITQNDDRKRDDLGVLSKYDRNTSDYATPREFYAAELAPKVAAAVKELRFFKEYGKDENLQSVDAVYREKIQDSLRGISDYDLLSREDIDDLVARFEQVKELIVNAR